jgi:predicted  nucleic acid-binding Zn-ribbon protein
MTKRRLTEKARLDVVESEEQIEEYKADLELLAEEEADAIQELQDKWEEIADEVDEIEVSPYKKDVNVELFGVAWLPHHLISSDGRVFELPAYARKELDV